MTVTGAGYYALQDGGLDTNDELVNWIANNVPFPSTMVDRITPAPHAGLSEEIENLFGIVNDASILAEEFIQWVIEDDFANSRPVLEEVGVQVVPSVWELYTYCPTART